MSDSVRLHRWQAIRLHHSWDSRGKNTGVGCHFLLQCMKVKSESEVPQSCLTLSDPMDCSLPGSSIHGIFQARVLEWVAIAFSKRMLTSALFTYSKTGCCCCSVSKLCPTLCDHVDCSSPGSSVHGDSPGKNTRVGCHTLLQGIFPTQGSNPHLFSLYRQTGSLPLVPPGKEYAFVTQFMLKYFTNTNSIETG